MKPTTQQPEPFLVHNDIIVEGAYPVNTRMARLIVRNYLHIEYFTVEVSGKEESPTLRITAEVNYEEEFVRYPRRITFESVELKCGFENIYSIVRKNIRKFLDDFDPHVRPFDLSTSLNTPVETPEERQQRHIKEDAI